MKLFSLPTCLLVAVAIVAFVKYDPRVAPELQDKSRTVATAAKPATVTGVRESGDCYFLVGKSGPISVTIGTSLWDAIDLVRLESQDLPQDPFAIGLVEDPGDANRRLVVAWKPPSASAAQP